MICLLDNFFFEAVATEKIKHSIDAKYSAFNPIVGNPIYHNTKGFSEKIVVGGKYINTSNSLLSVLENIAKKKEVVRFTLITGVSYKVIVENVVFNKEYFISYSGAVKIEFEIYLTVIEDDFSLLSFLLKELNATLQN